MEAIGTLAGGIAHDFNNILSVIIGYTEIAKGKGVNPDIESYLENVLNAGDRAKSLVKQILTYSRRTDQEKKLLDMSIIVKEAVKLLRATIPSTIEIQQVIEHSLRSVVADPTQIHQVLINLCANAAHAMRGKGGVLGITLQNFDLPESASISSDLHPGAYVRLDVSDTGTGIEPENLHRIFDPFFTTKGKDEGTGLGLSVVYGIVKGCRGTIMVQSDPGKGTTFSVYLPAIENTAGKVKERAGQVPRGTERILFVDDETDLAQMCREMLEALGYNVIAMTSSSKALDRFESDPGNFDLVITDMTMPGMTGVDLAKELLRIRPDIPIILCTGFSETVTEEKARQLGIREFLTKPVSLQDLAVAIRRVLG